MYNSQRDFDFNGNPKKTNCPNIVEFINATCRFYPGAETIAQDAYDKYVRWCSSKGLYYTSSFNVFARSFKYYAFHNKMVPNLFMHPVNYTAYKSGVGYIKKQGWAYTNLTINF